MAPRVVLLHARGPDLAAEPAHVYGPFESTEQAKAFDGEAPDGCFVAILLIVGPDPEDRARAEGHEGEVIRRHQGPVH